MWPQIFKYNFELKINSTQLSVVLYVYFNFSFLFCIKKPVKFWYIISPLYKSFLFVVLIINNIILLDILTK